MQVVKETVKSKDVASKSKLDKVINDGLKFDANTGGEKTNKIGVQGIRERG